MSKSLHASILTPDGSVFDGEISSLKVPGTNGNFQVLANHANLMSTLDIGLAEVQLSSNESKRFTINGGFVEVNQNVITVLAESAESPDSIDIDRAKAAKERAESRLKSSEFDRVRAESSLKRAVNRLKAAGV